MGKTAGKTGWRDERGRRSVEAVVVEDGEEEDIREERVEPWRDGRESHQ